MTTTRNRTPTAILLLAALAAAVLLLAPPRSAEAQEPVRAVTLLAGPSQYDLGGTGTTPAVAARVDLPLTPLLLLEPGFTYLPYDNQFGPRIHHLLPEVQLQVQRPGGELRPYLGVGSGASFAVRPGDDDTDLTLSTAAGLRWLPTPGWVLRGEFRVRVIEPWVGTTGDWSLGVGRRF